MNTIKIYLAFAAALMLGACQKSGDIAPGNGQDAYLNFYNASEVLQQNMTLSANNLILINDTVPGANQLQFSQTDDFRQFPQTITGNQFNVDIHPVPAGMNYNVVFWMPVLAGNHHITYTATKNADLKDTTVTISAKSFTTQYLVESPVSNDAYRVVTVPEERLGTAGKVRVKVINLSPDLGPMEVIRTDKDGNAILESLPAALKYGEHSPYADIDTAGISKTRGQLLLKFRKSGSNAVLLTKVIDAIPNTSFTMVLQGFEKETVRRIKTASQTFQTVTVNPNLRVNVRRIF